MAQGLPSAGSCSNGSHPRGRDKAGHVPPASLTRGRRMLSALVRFGCSEHGATLAIIAFATFSAMLWALIRIPGAGGPDESTHLDLIERIREAGGIPLFHGFDRSEFTWTPGRVINAYELTPSLSALVLAGLAGMLQLGDPVATLVLSRIFAVCLFPFTLFFGYLTLRILISDRPVERLQGLTVLATLPQLMLVHSYVTNDTPTIVFASLATYLAVRGWAHGFRTLDAVLLGVALGLVGLHKANGLIVVPMAVGLVVWRLRQKPGRLVRILITVAITAFPIAGWWYVRMLVIYGDPFGTETTRAAAEAVDTAIPTSRDQGLSPWEYAWSSGWVEGTFRPFWASYGVHRMPVPDTGYFAFLVILVLGTVGLLTTTWRARDGHGHGRSVGSLRACRRGIVAAESLDELDAGRHRHARAIRLPGNRSFCGAAGRWARSCPQHFTLFPANHVFDDPDDGDRKFGAFNFRRHARRSCAACLALLGERDAPGLPVKL